MGADVPSSRIRGNGSYAGNGIDSMTELASIRKNANEEGDI